jgi:glycine betaine/proline transport system substrate-binding protein
MFVRWNLRFLDDPKGVFGREESIRVITRRGFEQDMPDVAAFFRNMKLTDQQLGTLMDQINQSRGDPVRVARQWIDEHRELVSGWLPKQIADQQEGGSEDDGGTNREK